MTTKAKTKALRKMLMTTANRRDFFGYADHTSTAPASLKISRARCCVRWAGTRGFLGLAEDGPNENCRIGPAADTLELFNITSIADVKAKATEAWERAPWSR